MTPRTSRERRQLIHDLLAEEIRADTDEDGSSSLVTSWVALVGVQSLDPGEDEEDYGWVGRVMSYPTPPSHIVAGLMERERENRLAILLAAASRRDDDS